jgi:hypothetical protein
MAIEGDKTQRPQRSVSRDFINVILSCRMRENPWREAPGISFLTT